MDRVGRLKQVSKHPLHRDIRLFSVIFFIYIHMIISISQVPGMRPLNPKARQPPTMFHSPVPRLVEGAHQPLLIIHSDQSTRSEVQDRVHPLKQIRMICGVRYCTKGLGNFQKLYSLIDHLRTNILAGHQPTSKVQKKKRIGRKSFRCRMRHCDEHFNSRAELMRHRINVHLDPQRRRGEWTSPYPWIDEDGREDPALRRLLEDSRLFIFDEHRHGRLHSIFNFPLDPRRWAVGLRNGLEVVRETTREAVKLNLSLGMVLRHRETGDYRYFVPAGNVPLIPQPQRIDTQADWDRFAASLQPDQLMERIVLDRPNSKWQLALVTNLRVDIYYLGVNMGAGNVPDYIVNNPNILALTHSRSTGHRYEDTYCAFRALAAHRNLKRGKSVRHQLETETKALQRAWGRQSVHTAELSEFERLFGLRLDVYSLDEDGAVYPRYLSDRKTGVRMVLNLFKDHLSLVINVEGYLSKYKCVGCDRHFQSLRNLNRHRGRCARSTRIDFTHEHFRPRSTIFERLDEVGVHVPHSDRVFPWFATFDCESVLKPSHERSDKLQWTARHEAVSISLASNVPGYREPCCFVDADRTALSHRFVASLEKLSDKAYECARERWSDVFQALEIEPEEAARTEGLKELFDDPAFCESREDLRKSFYGYCHQLPVLGFNSSSYDINVLKGSLFPALGFDANADGNFVIKKNNSYTVVGARGVRFLDITNYLAPGFSYSQFLKAYGVPEAKSYFPYEWFDDVAKLDHPSLPPYEAFNSTLKNANVLDVGEGEMAGRRRHLELEDIWAERGMTKFKDFLEYYNNLDVGPFVTAVEKMQNFYFDKHIDLFKVAVSVPGVARSMLYKTAADAGVSFSSVRPGDEDMYYLIKQNIVGGPSLIFTRDHEAGRTKMRNAEDILCAIILGYDANALYLWAIDQFMPTGDYVRRFGPDLTPTFKGNLRNMFHWMDYVSKAEGITIWHQRNHGEVKIGPYSVDGFEPGTKTVFEYDGCYFHGCVACGFGRTEWREKRARDTKKRREWLENSGYTVRVMKGHEFRAAISSNRQLHDFVDARIPPFYRRYRGAVTAEQIMAAVRRGPDHFFGMVEVDIHVPEALREHFSEMCPIFANTDVAFADIGTTMQNYARARHMPETSRRLLISGLSAEKILVSSALLEWYLEHGLVVTKIHQVIEYTPVRCFRSFVEQVTEARRRGDVDPNMKIIADTMKLIGNSGYGSMIMDKEKHENVKFYSDVWAAQQAINSPRFRRLNEFSDDLYEISSAKASIRLDLPVQIGFQILQLAKLRMLQFYYDCLDTHCDRSRFEMVEMDTDSAYFAVGGTYIDQDGTVLPATQLLHIAKDPAHFMQLFAGSCSDVPHTPDEGHYFPRTCCPTHKKFDSRTPGLFKLEALGDAMIGLCSKTYVLQSQNAVKVTSKGLNKRTFDDPLGVFRNVLRTGDPASGVNRGIRVRDGTMYTYQQQRSAISYFYCKRQVLPDGVHTIPLPTVLKPWPQRTLDLVVPGHPLWPDTQRVLGLSAGRFDSLRDVCAHAMTVADPEALVLEALTSLPLYKPCGELVFVAEDGFHPKKDKLLANRWTCGLNSRCAELVSEEKYPGHNKLGQLYMEVVVDGAE